MIGKRTTTTLRRLSELGAIMDRDDDADGAICEEFRTLQASISDELTAFVRLLIDAKQLTVCVDIDELFVGGKLAEYQYVALEPIEAYPNGSVWMDAVWDGTGGFREGTQLIPKDGERSVI